MDRNYFLSYGQIAFLLLLSAIGKLNARIISATESKFELLRYTDIKDTDCYPYLSYSFLQDTVSSAVYDFRHHIENHGDSQDTVFGNSLHDNFPIVTDYNFFLLPMKDLRSVFPLNKWRVLHSVGHIEVLSVIKQVKRFSINSARLIDGFKFIIKIPDKLMIASIK
ncbi:hypothetical protein [Chryseobacterium sp. c4a]|uniref:hypothetical protein n=1 Tax=Chryseobacterium sp. c4a TaxID=1573582 RepID=UPI0013584C0D|nr:hypothetical protein [Chryseobacterium sp. c4a]